MIAPNESYKNTPDYDPLKNIPQEQWYNYHWQEQNAVKNVSELEKYFHLTYKQKKEIEQVLVNTKILITPYLLNLIEKDENGYVKENDPIWQQYVPSLKENELLEYKTSWEQQDEMFADGLTEMERKNTPIEKREFLGQHKYPDKVVVRVSHICGSLCRFCYEQERTLQKSFKSPNIHIAKEQSIDYISQHHQIREVILTGGDPLMLADAQLQSWIECFQNIKTIESVRIHTRMPAQNPYRITREFVNMLQNSAVHWMNIQINHPNELTDKFFEKIKLLQMVGITIKTENPILKNINDNPSVLADLIRKCRTNGISHHHWFHSMPITPKTMRISIERMVLLFQKVQEQLGYIRWNASELGDLVIPHKSGKRTIPFEEIDIDLNKPREQWGTNKFQFSVGENGNPIVQFSSWNMKDKNHKEYIDPNINIKNLPQSDFFDLLKK